jgi:hypothetical protein
MKFQPGTQFKIDNVAQLEAAYEAYAFHFKHKLDAHIEQFNKGERVLCWLVKICDEQNIFIELIDLYQYPLSDYRTIPNPFKHIRG